MHCDMHVYLCVPPIRMSLWMCKSGCPIPAYIYLFLESGHIYAINVIQLINIQTTKHNATYISSFPTYLWLGARGQGFWPMSRVLVNLSSVLTRSDWSPIKCRSTTTYGLHGGISQKKRHRPWVGTYVMRRYVHDT